VWSNSASPCPRLCARYELGCYERENARWRRPRFTARTALHRVEGALVYAAVLLFFFAAQRRHALSIDWLAAGAANAGRIVDGEWWRTVTALALHIELGHLMSNLVFGMIISLLMAELLGSGLAWLDQVRPKLPKLAALLDDAEEDVLAYMAFPKEHRAKIPLDQSS
jgi:hypothetical protein